MKGFHLMAFLDDSQKCSLGWTVDMVGYWKIRIFVSEFILIAKTQKDHMGGSPKFTHMKTWRSTISMIFKSFFWLDGWWFCHFFPMTFTIFPGLKKGAHVLGSAVKRVPNHWVPKTWNKMALGCANFCAAFEGVTNRGKRVEFTVYYRCHGDFRVKTRSFLFNRNAGKKPCRLTPPPKMVGEMAPKKKIHLEKPSIFKWHTGKSNDLECGKEVAFSSSC